LPPGAAQKAQNIKLGVELLGHTNIERLAVYAHVADQRSCAIHWMVFGDWETVPERRLVFEN